MGQVLLIGLVVIFFSSIAVFVFSQGSPDDIPRADLQVWMDGTSDTIYLKHGGGEAISGNEIKVVIMVNGVRNEISPENMSAKLGGDGIWDIGDVIQIRITDELGINVNSGDNVNLFVIHTPSENVIQKMDIIAS